MLMSNSNVGTVQQPDLEALVYSHKEGWVSKFFWRTTFIIFIIAFFGGYNTAACALGRFMLDHFHLWNRTIPTDLAGIDKHAELIAAFVSGCLATLVALGILFPLGWIDGQLKKREVKYRFLHHNYTVVWAGIFASLGGLTVTGEIFHPRFQHISIVSMLGVYGFGNLLILPTLALLLYVAGETWDYFARRRGRWRRA
ncbi:hypothetical protein DL96DRAFT_1625165 [Flagelloscypha sp. PMI_526]|nr:hypothetical protein DL96DRAFT_1625165 [Flagelloscypha sp. PMI_526]